MSPQFKNLARLCTRCISALALTVVLGFSSLQAQEHYTWVADDDGSWMDPDNWFPRGVPGLEDEDFVIFDHDGNFTITEVPHGIVLRGMELKGKGTTMLMAELPNTEIYMGVDDPNPIFKINKDAVLVVLGGNATRFVLSKGCEAEVQGTMMFIGNPIQPANHQFLVSEAGMMHFRPGGTFVMGAIGSRYSGFPFGNTLPNNAVVFHNGSKLIQNDGSDPFGPSNISKISMLKGSTFEFASPFDGVLPVMMGRTFGHFHYTSLVQRTVSATGNINVDDFLIKAGRLTLNFATGNNIMNIYGDVQVPDNPANPNQATVTLQSTSGTVSCFFHKNGMKSGGNSTMLFTSRARLTIPTGVHAHVSHHIEVSQTPLVNTSFGLVDLQRDAGLYMYNEFAVRGTGRFNMGIDAVLGIGSVHGINTAPSTQGNIITNNRQFNVGGVFAYIGNANQEIGSGLPNWGNQSPQLVVRIQKSPGSRVSLTRNFYGSIIELDSGALDLNGRVLQLGAFQNRTTGIVTGGTIRSKAGSLLMEATGSIIEWQGAGKVEANGYLALGNMRLTTGVGEGLDFGSTGQPTLTGELRIQNGTRVTGNAPFYAASSQLIYAVTGTSYYSTGAEWAINVSEGRGVPHNVQVGLPGVSGTLLSLGTTPGIRYCTGLMRVGHPGNNLTYGLQVPAQVELVVAPKVF